MIVRGWITVAATWLFLAGAMTGESKKTAKNSRCAWDPSLDALAAAPGNHRVLFEKESVRVLDVVVPPKTREPVHAHCWPSVLYVMSAGPFVDYDAEGRVLFDSRKAPSPPLPVTEWMGPQAPHAVENLGDVPLHLVRVEIKGK